MNMENYFEPNPLCPCGEDYPLHNKMFCYECDKLPKSWCMVCGLMMVVKTDKTPIFCSELCAKWVKNKKEAEDVLTHVPRVYEYTPDIKEPGGHDWASYRVFYSSAFEENDDIAWDEHGNFVSCVWKTPDGTLYELYRDGLTWIDLYNQGLEPIEFDDEADWWEYVTAEGKRKYHEVHPCQCTACAPKKD